MRSLFFAFLLFLLRARFIQQRNLFREINIDRLLEFWYDKNEKKIKEYQYIIMLGLGPEEIERMYSITKDRLVKKYMEEVKRVNEDPRFREYMTKEEDQKKILKSLITEATAEGEKVGEKQKAIEIDRKAHV